VKAVHYARYGGPEVLAYADVPDPQPADDEVLIAVHATSVAPGDCKVRAGLLQDMFPITLPKIPGRDGAGVIVATGRQVDYATVGDAVCFVTQHVEQGGAAELAARARKDIAPKPDNLSFVEATTIIHAGVCAWIGLVETAKVEAGMTVLVHGGSGSIGSLAVQLAKHLGATVAATCNSRNVDYVTGLGADTVIAYDRQDFAERLRDVDVVFDLVGGDTHERSYRVLRKGGVIAWLIAAPFEDRSAAFGVRDRQAVIDDRPGLMAKVLDLAGAGVLRPQVAKVLPLARCAEAHRLMEAGAISRGRIVLQVR
jgi:NADPH:quinone reductase-like Zn-dependent oxidoreductase